MILLPSMPEGWWLAYIYPMHHRGTWVADARSISARARGEDADLEWAISKAIAAIEAGEITQEKVEKREAKDLLAELGLVKVEPIKRRKL